MEFLRGKLLKLRISLGVEQKTYMEFFGAGALIFTIFFRGTCIPIFLTGRPIFYRGIPIFLTGRPIFYRTELFKAGLR